MNLVLGYFAELGTGTRDGWNRFWFTPADPATLGLIRILTGAMLFYTHLVWTVDLTGFFGPEGWLPLEFVHQYHGSPYAWSYLYWITSPALLYTVHIAGLVVLAMFMLGFGSRVTSILAYLIMVAYVHRAAGALFGLDQINTMLAMYLMIGPCGAAYSLDRVLARARAGGPLPAAPPSVSANIAIRLVQLHMCVIYLFAGLGKLLGASWWDGTALWGAFANYEYQTLDMTWLAAWPLLINVLTHVTIVWEVTYAALVWPRLTRPLVVLLAVPLHLGIAVCMGMITFGLVMIVGNVAFVSPAVVRSILEGPFQRGRAGRSHKSG